MQLLPSRLIPSFRSRRRRQAETVAKGIGLVCVVLGAAEVLAPGRLAKAIGLRGFGGLFATMGARDVVTGAGLLFGRDPAFWLWSRAGSDAMDVVTFSTAAALGDDRKRGTALWTLAGAIGFLAADLWAARALRR